MKYVVRPLNAKWMEDVPMIQNLTVFEEEKDPVKTGLLDQNGHPIYRVPEKIKIGF